MANFLNVDVLFGQNALTNTTSFVNQIDSVTIRNGKFQHCNMVNYFDENIDTTIPSDWDNTFIMNAPFEDGAGAGSVSNLLNYANQILVKHRPSNVYSNIADGWTTIAKINISDAEDLIFTVYDYTCKNNTEYEYVLVPTLIREQGGLIVSTETSITENSTILTVNSQFNKIYICSNGESKSLYAGTSYDNTTTNISVGVHQTLGSKYPIVVTNSSMNYESGGVTARILNEGYGTHDSITGDMINLNRRKIIEAREDYINFITKGKPYILKDWNGNAWLIMITDSPSYSWESEWGMGLGSVTFNWTEIGNLDDTEDLSKADMIDVR